MSSINVEMVSSNETEKKRKPVHGKKKNNSLLSLLFWVICSHPMKPSSNTTAGPPFSNCPPTLLGTAGGIARGPNRTLAP